MILLNDVLPSRSVASNTATDEGIDGLDIVQSALPRGVTPGPIPLTAKDLYEKARPEVQSNQADSARLWYLPATRDVRMVFACIVAGAGRFEVRRTREIRGRQTASLNACAGFRAIPEWLWLG